MSFWSTLKTNQYIRKTIKTLIECRGKWGTIYFKFDNVSNRELSFLYHWTIVILMVMVVRMPLVFVILMVKRKDVNGALYGIMHDKLYDMENPKLKGTSRDVFNDL